MPIGAFLLERTSLQNLGDLDGAALWEERILAESHVIVLTEEDEPRRTCSDACGKTIRKRAALEVDLSLSKAVAELVPVSLKLCVQSAPIECVAARMSTNAPLAFWPNSPPPTPGLAARA